MPLRARLCPPMECRAPPNAIARPSVAASPSVARNSRNNLPSPEEVRTACLDIGVALSRLASSSMKGAAGARRSAAPDVREAKGEAASAAALARNRRRERDIGEEEL